MTITDSDRSSFQAQIKEFHPQINEDMCLSTSIKNILDRLSEDHHVPELSNFSVSTLNEMCEYQRHRGSTARHLPRRLGPEIEPLGYEVKMDTQLNIENLQELIDNEDTSLPIVGLDPRFYDSVDLYDVDAGKFGERMPHTVVVLKVNHEDVLFYDPLKDYYWSEGDPVPPSERPRRLFVEWWGGRSEPFWTLWIERSEQQTLGN